MDFKVGDIVEAFGCRGQVVYMDEFDDYALNVALEKAPYHLPFTLDGRLYTWHKAPSLKLIERPKKKVKKILTRWVNVYNDDSISEMYESKKAALSYAIFDGLVECVPIEITYEAEEG